MHITFWLENLKKRPLDVDGRMILERTLGWEDVDWMRVAQDDKWRVLLNMVMSIRLL
jgi:hypothetical protein